MLLVVLFTIFVSQNTNVIPVNAFLWKFQMSTIVLMSITFFIGLLLGFIITSLYGSPKKNEKAAKEV